jgi:hypothetical protein
MPSSKQSSKVVAYFPNSECPQRVFERVVMDRSAKVSYTTSVFDIGDDILELICSEFYNAAGEFVYKKQAVITVRRNAEGVLSSVVVRLTSAKNAVKQLGNLRNASKRVVQHRRRVGPESK